MKNSLAKKRIKVLIVEDHPVTARGLEATVRDMEECRLAGVALTTEDARRIATAEQPDVIMLDIRLGGSAAAGLQLARDLRDLSPNSRILVFSVFVHEGDVATLAAIGIRGYVVKGEPTSVIATAIRIVAAGQTYFSRSVDQIVRRLLRSEGPPALGPDEIEILRLVASGLSTNEIARRLSIGRTTTTRRLTSIFQILGVATRAEAVAKAAELGYFNSG